MPTLKQQTVSSVKWLVGSSFLQKGIQFSATIVLARILGPKDFGLFALAFVAIDALGLFKSMGFDSALIQRKDEVEKAANTAFFIIPLLGIVLYLILSISAPWIGKFMNNMSVISVIRALGIIFIISCFGRVPAALMEKRMQFRQISIIEISTVIVYSVSAVVFALFKFGVWSLVYAYILKTLNQNILTFIYSKWRPKLEFDKKIALEMFHFGKFVFLGAIVWFLKMNLDNLLVGKFLGVAALGLYAIAFNIANFGADYFGNKVARVIFPTYSKLQSDLYDLKSATLKTLKYISIIAIPFSIALFLLSGEFLRFFYGERWIGATNVLRILAFAGIFNTLPAGMSVAFLACGKPKLGFWITTFQVAIFFIFIYPMAKLFGINGVGVVVTLSGFIAFIITLIWAMKLLSMELKQVCLSFRPALIASLFMAFGIVFLQIVISYFHKLAQSHYSFILLSLSAVVIYGFLLFKREGQLLKEMKELMFS